MAVLLVSGSAYALLDTVNNRNNSPEATATSDSTALAGAAAVAGSSAIAGNANIIKNENYANNTTRLNNKNSNKQAQGQIQGQVANGEVNVTGDTNKVYANTWPAVGATEGVSSATGSTIFGSLGLSSTEIYKKMIPQIQAIQAIDPSIMSIEDKKEIINTMVTKLANANRKQRILGIGPEITGKSLINLFGILSWDSIWNENQAPFQCKSDIK